MSIETMKLALAALETCRIRSVSEWSVEDITPKNVTAAIEALRTAIQQAEAQQPVTGEPVYWEWRHLSTHPDTVDFGKWSEWKRVEARSAIHTIEDALAEFRAYIAHGYKYELRALYTRPAPSAPNLIEKAISSGYFGVLPVKATIPMCKAGWGASGGELTFQQIGHIYEEMYKARPLPDDAIYAAPSVPADVVRVPLQVLKDASEALGNFVSDHGWGDTDMQAMDNLDAYIARHEAIDAAMLAAKETP